MPLITRRMVILKVKDIIGPLPDWGGLIVLTALKKCFPIKCSVSDAAACSDIISGYVNNSPYSFVVSSLRSVAETTLERAEMTVVEKHPYAMVRYKSPAWRKALRMSTDNPAHALNMSLSAGEKFMVERHVFDSILDSYSSYELLKKRLGRLWPLAPLTRTEELKALDEYMEASMPGGSIFL